MIHSDTLRKRSASSLVESWVPPFVVASAVLRRAQTQGRAAQVDPPHRDFLGPEMPRELETLPSVAKAVPKPSDNTARTPPVPFDSSVLPKDPSVSELLEKLASLIQRLSARRSLGGVLADTAAELAGNKYRKREEFSNQHKRRRFSDVSGRGGGGGLQQTEKFLSQRGGVSNEANNDELATRALQYLMSVFHGAHPQSSMSLRNSRELRTIAERIEALLAGDLPHLGDLLMQRLKAVQVAVVEGKTGILHSIWNSFRRREATLQTVKRSQKSLKVVLTQTGQSSLTASCANSEVASSTSENSVTFITRQDFSNGSSGNSEEHVAEPFSRKGSSPSSAVTTPGSPHGGVSRFSLRNTDGQESQFQKKAKSEKYLSAGHHGETGRSLHEG